MTEEEEPPKAEDKKKTDQWETLYNPFMDPKGPKWDRVIIALFLSALGASFMMTDNSEEISYMDFVNKYLT